jgi:hypothetical protein
MTDDTMRQVLDEIREANRWLRVLAAPLLRERLEEQLRTATERKIYQASVGGGGREVGRAAGVSQPTVSAAWRRWASAGIVAPTDTPGRYQRLVDLESLGIEVDGG